MLVHFTVFLVPEFNQSYPKRCLYDKLVRIICVGRFLVQITEKHRKIDNLCLAIWYENKIK